MGFTQNAGKALRSLTPGDKLGILYQRMNARDSFKYRDVEDLYHPPALNKLVGDGVLLKDYNKKTRQSVYSFSDRGRAHARRIASARGYV